MKTRKQIIEWLSNQPWKGDFYENCFKRKISCNKDLKYDEDFVLTAFNWGSTKQGFEYWAQIDTEYLNWYHSNSKPLNANGYEYVDLGLPSGTLWAKCNVGAIKETDYGGYYQWGGIEDFTNTKKNCNWKIYPYGTSYDTPTKYNLKSEWGKVDNKTELELSDDVANQIMGGDWHIPSREQFCELVNNTTSEWTTVGGVNGRRFTSKFNGQSIFIPAAGYRDYRTLLHVGYYCYLWSSSLYQARPSSASNLYFNSDDYSIEDFNRYYGFSVRGVMN